jgi:hypothetical protein
MDVSTITMDPADAERRLKEYRRHKHHAADSEYQRAAVAYEQLAKGTPLVILSEAINNAPRDAKGRPRLALARADRRQVMLEWNGQRDAVFNSAEPGVAHRGRWPELVIEVRLERGLPDNVSLWSGRGYALVPMVPPDVLGNRAPKTHFILWEVEAWADSRIGAAPDRDPYLLRRVADDLFAVVGEWDLTDVERAIMRSRRDV